MKETRIPRPKGLTLQMIQIHKNKDNKQLERLKEIVLQQWISAGMMYNGRLVSMEEMGSYLQLSMSKLYIKANRAMIAIAGMFEGDKLKEIARVLFSTALFKASEIQALSEVQTRILMAHQGNKYMPYVSGEVNRAIANQINAGKPLMEVLRLLAGAGNGQNANTFIYNDNSNNSKTAQFITPDQAVNMIQNKVPDLLENPDALNTKMLEYKDIPDVNARTQDLSEIGIKNSQEFISKSGLINKKLSEKKRRSHENRRQLSEGILDLTDNPEVA